MSKFWVTLPHTWTLQDTQAGLNVTIAFLCAGLVFVLVRSIWILAARQVMRDHEVPIYSLVSLNTIGETIDIIWLLRKDFFTRPYLVLVVQCVGVLLLTVGALMSGFIARFSSRGTTVLIPHNTSGTLAIRSGTTTYFGAMEASSAIAALRHAEFPQDRMLDFWPDPASMWVYEPNQWSNYSWSMDCKYTPLTPVPGELIATNDTCEPSFRSQLPFLYNIWDDNVENMTFQLGYNTWRDRENLIRKGVAFLFSDDRDNVVIDEKTNMYTKMQFRVATVYLDAPIADTSDSPEDHCMFTPGPISRGDYTKVVCDLVRNTAADKNRTEEETNAWGAYPEADHDRVQEVMREYYGNSWYRELWASKPVTIVEGEEMARFYQAFSITRDTKGYLYDNTSNIATVARGLSVPMPAPQVSLICIILCSIGLFLVLVGLINYFVFLFFNRDHLYNTPQSKLDWVLHTVRLENEQNGTDPKHKLHHSIGLGMNPNPQLHYQPQSIQGLYQRRRSHYRGHHRGSSYHQPPELVELRENEPSNEDPFINDDHYDQKSSPAMVRNRSVDSTVSSLSVAPTTPTRIASTVSAGPYPYPYSRTSHHYQQVGSGGRPQSNESFL